MLLRNESRIRHSIDISLVFDDNKKRVLTIQECDQVQISYRKNGCLRHGVGVIRDIKPYVYTKKFPHCQKESAIIVLDMSEDHVCCVDRIDLYDIIDIRKINIQDSNSNSGCNCNCNNSDFVPKKPKRRIGVVGAPLTNKGVVSRE